MTNFVDSTAKFSIEETNVELATVTLQEKTY